MRSFLPRALAVVAVLTAGCRRHVAVSVPCVETAEGVPVRITPFSPESGRSDAAAMARRGEGEIALMACRSPDFDVVESPSPVPHGSTGGASAELLIAGTVSPAGTRLLLAVRGIDVVTGQVIVSDQVAGPADSVAALMDAMSSRFLDSLRVRYRRR